MFCCFDLDAVVSCDGWVDRTIQLAFRLLSRLGKTFDAEKSALDIEDIR